MRETDVAIIPTSPQEPISSGAVVLRGPSPLGTVFNRLKQSGRVVNPTTFAGALVLLAIVYVNRGVLLESGSPFGADAWGHLARVWYMAEVLAAGEIGRAHV